MHIQISFFREETLKHYIDMVIQLDQKVLLEYSIVLPMLCRFKIMRSLQWKGEKKQEIAKFSVIRTQKCNLILYYQLVLSFFISKLAKCLKWFEMFVQPIDMVHFLNWIASLNAYFQDNYKLNRCFPTNKQALIYSHLKYQFNRNKLKLGLNSYHFRKSYGNTKWRIAINMVVYIQPVSMTATFAFIKLIVPLFFAILIDNFHGLIRILYQRKNNIFAFIVQNFLRNVLKSWTVNKTTWTWSNIGSYVVLYTTVCLILIYYV